MEKLTEKLLEYLMSGSLSDLASPSRVKRYFAKFPLWVFSVSFPVLLISLCAGDLVLTVTVCLGVLVSWGLVISLWNKRPSGEKIDALLLNQLSRISGRSMDQTNLSMSQLIGKSVWVMSPWLRPSNDWYTGIRLGEDGVLRFTPVRVTVFHFTADLLACYQCLIDLEGDCLLRESNHQYFYEDIVAVSVEVKDEAVDRDFFDRNLASLFKEGQYETKEDEVIIRDAREFLLTSKAGTKISAYLPSLGRNWCADGSGVVGSPEDSVRQVQTMVFDKKRSIRRP